MLSPKFWAPHPFGYLSLWNFSIFSCILNIYKNAQDSPITKTNKPKTKMIPPPCAPLLLHAHFLLSFKVCFLKVYFICCFLLDHLYTVTVGNVVSVLDESVLFMIIGVLLTGKSVGLYCLKFLWCYSTPPLWNWTFMMLLRFLFFFRTTPYGSFWKFFPLILEFPGSVLNLLSCVCRYFLHHQVCLDPVSMIPKFTFPTRDLPWVQTQCTFPFGCSQSRQDSPSPHPPSTRP